jgi:hypothetical protein
MLGCGITEDGLVECFGDSGVEGVSYIRTPFVGTFTDVALGSQHVCAVSEQRTILCSPLWRTSLDPSVLRGPSGEYQGVAVGFNLSCGLRTDQTVVCWGINPVELDGEFTEIRAWSDRVCGLATDGQVRCAGPDPYNLGNNPDSGFLAAGIGQTAVCALDAAGTPVCWGIPPCSHELVEP